MNSLNINVCKVMKRKTLIEEDKKKIEISLYQIFLPS